MTDSAGDKTTINVWLNDYPFPGFLDPVKEAARTFGEAHPEYEIEIHGEDFRTMPAKLAAAVAEGNRPEVAEYFYTSTQLARDMLDPDGNPLFTTVAKAIGGRTEILGEPVLVDDVVPAARDHFSDANGVVSVPPTASTVLLYANMNILNAAGISSVPRTWREVSEACAAIAALPDGPAHRISWPNHVWMFLQSVAQQGGLLVDNDNGRSGRAEKIDLATDELLAFASWWQGLHKDGHFLYTGKVADWNSCFNGFAEQELAFILSSSVDARRLMGKGEKAGFTVEMARMPYNDEVPFAGNLIGGDSLWLADGLDERTQDGALAFIQHLIKPRKAAEWHKANGRLPITRASIKVLEDEGWFEQNPHLRVATDQLDAGDGSPGALGPVFGNFAAIQKEVTRAMNDVLTQGADPKARFTEATEKAQELLDAYNAHVTGPPRRTPDKLKVAW